MKQRIRDVGLDVDDTKTTGKCAKASEYDRSKLLP